ncbi:MAG: hypothetical protein ACKV2U_32685 [Bryobacteraceae bacterium]
MRIPAIFLGSLAAIAQSTEVKELRFRFDPEGRVRPGETVAVQVQVWGDAIASDGTRTNGRLRETANAKVADGNGWLSKPYRFQGVDDGGFVNTGGTGFAQIFQNVSGQFVLKDAVLYTAPAQPGAYAIEAEAKGVKGSAQISVTVDAPSRKTAETTSFPAVADNNRYRKLAEYWAPFIAQETWWQPKADIPTRFDFDGDWNGDNNWDNTEAGTSQAYVHYAGVETKSHWFLHYNFFHPRDYSDNCVAGTCHENDNEGIILAVRKDGGEFGTLELMETLAHNNVYSYANDNRLRKGAHDIDAKIDFHDGHHPMVYLEAGGHGALAVGARNSTFSAARQDFTSGSGVTLVYKGAAERPLHGNDRNVGYDLISIEDTWWQRAQQAAGDRIFDAPYDYQPFGNRPGGGLRYMGSFRGRKHGANKAKPFWGWHDERTRRGKVLNTGQWALDPAFAMTRNLIWPATLPVDLDYIYNPYLGVGENAVPRPEGSNNIAAAPTEGTCQLEAVIDGSVIVAVRGETASYQVLSGQAEKESSIGCTGVIPERPMAAFEIRKTKGRGTLRVLESPGAANSFTARVQIDDSGRGADRYVLVVRWKL